MEIYTSISCVLSSIHSYQSNEKIRQNYGKYTCMYFIFSLSFILVQKKSFHVHATFLISFYQILLWMITKVIWTIIGEIWSKHKSNSISHAWKDIFYRKMIQKNSRRQLQKKRIILFYDCMAYAVVINVTYEYVYIDKNFLMCVWS